MPDERFPRRQRLRGKTEFDRVFRTGIVVSDSTLVVKALSNGQNFTRVGITIPRVTGDAPTRNHWKRLIREAFRKSSSQLPVGLDLVVRPRRGAADDFHAVSLSLKKLCLHALRKLE